MKLAIDIDGVLAQFDTAYTQLLMKIDPTIKVDVFAADFPVAWSIEDYYGFSPETVDKAWAEIKNCGIFWKFLFPYPTAWADIEALNAAKRSHDIYFLTNRPGATAKRETEEWLRGHGFDRATVVICSKKQLFCEAAEIDVLIDDKVDNCWNHKSTRTFLFKRPYNKEHWSAYSCVDTVREALDGI